MHVCELRAHLHTSPIKKYSRSDLHFCFLNIRNLRINKSREPPCSHRSLVQSCLFRHTVAGRIDTNATARVVRTQATFPLCTFRYGPPISSVLTSRQVHRGLEYYELSRGHNRHLTMLDASPMMAGKQFAHMQTSIALSMSVICSIARLVITRSNKLEQARG